MSADGESWFLINASPDLRMQIERRAALHPRVSGGRGTPIEGVLLTNADLDHVLGLLLLREGRSLQICATPPVRVAIEHALGFGAVLGAFCQVAWSEPTSEFVSLDRRDGSPSGLICRAIALPGGPPPFARDRFPTDSARSDTPSLAEAHSIAFQIAESADGPRLLIAPDVSALIDELQAAIRESAAVLIDGTFWDDDELRRLSPGARTSREMGHVPVSGADGSLAMLRPFPSQRRSYLHINNTNPILRRGSPERAEVDAAGIRVEEDGTEFIV